MFIVVKTHINAIIREFAVNQDSFIFFLLLLFLIKSNDAVRDLDFHINHLCRGVPYVCMYVCYSCTMSARGLRDPRVTPVK